LTKEYPAIWAKVQKSNFFSDAEILKAQT
jgi:hypothetical protein